MGRRNIATVKVAEVEKRRSPSKHYVYVIRVAWSDGTTNTIYRRYSKFFDFQNDLLDRFPDQAGKDDPNHRIIPFLPGKKFFGRSHIREVAEKRLKPIDEYCQTLIKLPSEISESDEVLEFFEVEPEDIEPIKQRHVSRKAKGEKISRPKLLEQYVALADYTPQGKGEIPLRQGISIEVAEKTETGWWFVTAEDEQGWVPSTYLQRVDGREDTSTETSEPGQEEDYVCTTPFTPESPDEITIEIGNIVQIIEKNLQGWWKVRLGRQEGYVPAAYLSKVNPDKVASDQQNSNRLSQGVQVVSSLSEVSEYFKPSSKKASIKQPPPRTNSLPRGSGPNPPASPLRRQKEYVTIDSFNSDSMGDGISFSAGDSVKVLEKNPSGWWYVEIGEQEGWAPAAYIQQLPETPGEEGEVISQTAVEEDDEFEDDSDSDSSEEDLPPANNMSAIKGSLMAKFGEKTGGSPRPADSPPLPPEKPLTQKVLPPTPAKPPAMPVKPPATPAKPPATPGKLPATPAKPPVTAGNGPATPAKPQTPPKLVGSASSHSKPVAMRPKPPGNKPALNRSSGEEEEWDNANLPSPKAKVTDLASALKAKFEGAGNGSNGMRRPKPPTPTSKPSYLRNSNIDMSKDSINSKPDPPSKAFKPSIVPQKSRYRASAVFMAENTGEISLNMGEDVSIVQSDNSGWWLIEKDGVEGWAPASYLEEVDNTSPVTSSYSGNSNTDNTVSNQSNHTTSNSLMDEISSKFGARLKPVQKPSQPSDNHKNGNSSPSSVLVPPSKKPSTASGPAVPIKPKPGVTAKGRLPQLPPQKPLY